MSELDATLAAIADIVGAPGLLLGDDVAARPATWLHHEPMQGAAIVRPAGTAELAAVMQRCHDDARAVVPLGGNTGLVDGTISKPDGVLVSLERMNAIEDIDAASGTMTVQAGVPLQTVQEAAAEADLYFPLDLGARGSATIGGNIATNAGGNGVIRYGMMREQVLGLEAVLADGTVMSSMNRMLKNNAGYDLKQLFIGTEGTLGIVTRAVLRLRPMLQSQATALIAVDAWEKVPRLLNLLGSELGGALTAFEVMWADFVEAVLADERRQAPLASGYPFYVLAEARGAHQQADEALFQRALEQAFEAELICDAAFAQSGQQRDAMWAIRDDIDYLLDELSPMLAFDVSLPISDAAEYADNVRRRLRERWPGAYRGTTFGHLGDGNLHFLITVGSDEREQQQEVMEIVYSELRPYGGSVSAEHGIGLEKRDFLHHSRSDVEIGLMRRLKAALDPKGILNPGKIF